MNNFKRLLEGFNSVEEGLAFYRRKVSSMSKSELRKLLKAFDKQFPHFKGATNKKHIVTTKGTNLPSKDFMWDDEEAIDPRTDRKKAEKNGKSAIDFLIYNIDEIFSEGGLMDFLKKNVGDN